MARVLQKTIRLSAYAVLAALGLLIATLWALRTFFLPDLSVLQPRIETVLSAALKQPVHIKGFRAVWELTQISFHVDSLSVGADQTPALRVLDVDATLDALPLLAQQLRLNTASVGQLDVTAQRSQAGVWSVAGVPTSSEPNPHSAQWLRTLLSANNIAIKRLELTVLDAQQRLAPTGRTQMVWTDAQLSTGVGKDYKLYAQSPLGLPDWGAAMTLDAAFNRAALGDVGDPASWREGIVNLNLAGADVARVENGLRAALLPTQGRFAGSRAAIAPYWLGKKIALHTALTFDAGVVSAYAQALLDNDAALLSPRHGAASVRAEWLELTAASSQLKLSVHGVFDLATLKRAPWPVDSTAFDALSQQIQTLKPSGQLEQAQLTVDLVRTAPQHWQTGIMALDANVQKLFLEAIPTGADRLPAALGHLSGRVQARYDLNTQTMQQLSAVLNSQDAWLDAPQWLTERVKVQQLTGSVTLDSAGRVELKAFAFRNPDVEWILDGHLQGSTVELTGQMPTLNLAALARYLPKAVSPELRDGLRNTLQQGQVLDGRLKLRGDLTRFPFQDASHATDVFEWTGRIQGASVAFGSDWPSVQQLQGKLTAQAGSLTLDAVSAQAVPPASALLSSPSSTFTSTSVSSSSLPLLTPSSPSPSPSPLPLPLPFTPPKLLITASTVRIADIHHPVLEFSAKTAGRAQAFADLLHATPLATQWRAQGIEPMLGGTAYLDGSWAVPLKNPAATQFTAQLGLNASHAQLFAGWPAMADVVLRADLNEQGITLNKAQAKWLGGAVQAEGALGFGASAHAKPSKRIALSGSLEVAQVSALAALTKQARWVAELGRIAKGPLAYTANIHAGAVANAWGVDATLDAQRLALNIPNVYVKPAGAALAMTVHLQQTLPNVWQTQIRAGEQFTAVLEHGFEGKLQSLQGVRGALALGEQATVNMPDAGFNAHIVLPYLDADALVAYVASLPWSSDLGRDNGAFGFAPALSVAVQVQDLKATGRPFKNVVAGLARGAFGTGEAQWRANVYADGINGFLTWSDSAARTDKAGTLTARLSTLVVPDSEVKTARQLLDIAPAQVPNIDLEVASLTVGGKPLGALNLKARHVALSGASAQPASSEPIRSSGWAIDTLQLKSADSELNAKGLWRKQGALAYVHLNVEASSQDLGATLARLGQTDVVKGAAGKLAGEVSWLGTPFALDIPSLQGTLKASLDKGQFLKIDPGAGRMLAVFSLQSIPRRLTLDFRDMFSDGFAFDSLAATAHLSAGVLNTDDFAMQSAAAEVRGTGRLDLMKETQDFRFTVKPDFNAGGVSLAYMLVNPPLGLGTLLVQWLLREPLRTQLTVEYDVKGPWNKPEVKQRDRNLKPKETVKVQP